MDTHAYDEWLGLWASDAHYWVPANGEPTELSGEISLVNENMRGIQDRITRLKSNAHYAQDPKSRLSRVVGNVEIESLNGDEVVVRSTFTLIASRRAVIDIFAARVLHRLRREGDDFRIAHKKVLLINNDEVINNLTFLI